MDNITESNPTSNYSWLVHVHDIKPGSSAILSENYLAFYTIHLTSIILNATSLIACPILIISILVRGTREKLDFSDRFPLYLAICDFLFGLSHMTDHLTLFVKKVYPSNTVATLLGINLWFFLSYQQMMHGGLAAYIYLKVVKRRYINLGRWEWKLHALCIGSTAIMTAVFYPLGSFGNAGYWFLHDVRTTAGRALGLTCTIFSSLQALCTTCGYSAIKKVITEQNEAVLSHQAKTSPTGQHRRDRPKRHSTATQCLTTFVLISGTFYCTAAVTFWTLTIQMCLDVLEPFSLLVLVILASSGGWANAMGYFYNNKLKAKRRASYSIDPLLGESTATCLDK